jgi:hypothetical protein
MNFNIYIFSALAIIGLSSVKLAAQDQQQETQVLTTSQETQTQNPVQVQNQTDVQQQPQTTQTPVAPKPKTFPQDLSITDQFGYAIEKSSNFQDYKVIKQTWMSKLKSNTLDTLLTLKTNLKSSKVLIEEKNKSIESLRSELNTSQSELKQKNSFRFFGIMVSKAGYDSIMWTIIIGLLVSLAFMFAAFRRSFAVTSQTRKDLTEVKDEFESFRKKALKSKEEAVRQLYDELNKYKNKK